MPYFGAAVAGYGPLVVLAGALFDSFNSEHYYCTRFRIDVLGCRRATDITTRARSLLCH